MKACFFTFLTDSYRELIQYDLFEKSIKHFHPEIPLIVFRDNDINELRKIQPSLDLFKAKATAAKTLYNDYDLVINIDADHFIFDRLDEILENDYDVAAPSNYNLYENVSISLKSYRSNVYDVVPEKTYIQAGLIASSNKLFWDTYETVCMKHADGMTCRDNDILNLIIQFGNFNFKLLDGDYDVFSPHRKAFYGCSSLNLENQITIMDNKPCINGVPVKAYHVAKGGGKPKLHEIFNPDVVEWFYNTIK